MKKVYLLFVLFLVLAATSCTSDSETPMITPPVNNVTYIGTVKAIIDANCITCHGDPILNGAPMPLLTLEHVKEAIENRNLIGRVEDGSMPNGVLPDLTAAQVQAIKDWEINNFLE